MENRKYVIWAPIIVLGLFVLGPRFALGYATETHAFLTNTAVNLYSKSFSQKIDPGLVNYILDGARREDDPPRWLNHFYDPVYERGLTQDNKIEPLYQLGNWEESKLWAQDSRNQNKIKYSPIIATILSSIQSGKIEKFFPTADFTWNEALRYWIQGNKEMAMFTLGHILHLIEDVSVPDHTRNDPHPGNSPYENYTVQYTLSNPDAKLSQSISNHTPISLPDLNSHFIQLATYSNNNFYSKDTVGIQSGYLSPEPDSFEPTDVNGQMEYYGMRKDPFDNGYSVVLKKSNSGNFIVTNKGDMIIADERIETDYWHLLSPKAVEYSAGVINLFFQETEKNKDNPEFTGKKSPTLLAQVTGVIADGWNATKDFVTGIFGSNRQFEPVAEVAIDNRQNGDGQQTQTAGPGAYGDNTATNPKPAKKSSTENKTVEKLYKVTRVIDGDTIVLENGAVIRYIGIDAPELAYQENKTDCFALEARQRNEELVLGKNVRLEYTDQKTDKYDRTLAYVWAGTALANKVLVKEGYAYAYNFNHPHPRADEFEADQTQAKTSGLGIWGPACRQTTGQDSTSTANTSTTTIQSFQSTSSASFCPYATSQSPDHQKLIINEVAWMGSVNSANDEWIELKNISDSPLDISGYQLIGKDNAIQINLSKSKHTTIGAGGFALLERTDDNSVPNITADIIYSGSLGNSNEGLRLFGQNCSLIDEVSAASSWPAGDNANKRAMERDVNGFGWHTSAIIGGTPKAENSYPYSSGGGGGGGGGSSSQTSQPSSQQSQTPQFYPVVINEIMYNPEGADTNREWIEIVNSATTSVDVSEWKLFESNTGHSLTILSGTTLLSPGNYAVITNGTSTIQFQSEFPDFSGNLFRGSFSLNNGGEAVALKNGDLTIDSVTYSPAQGADGNGKSLQKFPDGWSESAPTPGRENSRATSTSPRTESTNHIVISEVQVAGDVADDEFIELYNPTSQPLSLSNYSLQYISGKATSTKNVYKKEVGDATVPPLQFFLLANKDGKFAAQADNAYSFSLSGELSGGVIFLMSTTSAVSSVNDPAVMDYVAYGNALLPGITTSSPPSANQSIERKTLAGGLCVSPRDSGEFWGNGCDTNNNAADFEIRSSPRPQRLGNLAEPRTAPGRVNSFLASYSTSSVSIGLSWQPPENNGAASPFTYEVRDAGADTITTTTALLSYSNRVNEVGRDYNFSLAAIDPEGLAGEKSTSTVRVPSFLSSVALFKNPNDETKYVLEGTYGQYPFVPNLYTSVPNGGSIVAFFVNRDAPKNQEFPGGSDALVLDYKHCATDRLVNSLILSWQPCPQIATLASALPHEYLEDSRFSVAALPQTPLSSSDYITAAFYSFDHSSVWSGGWDYYYLVATDKTKYYISTSTPPHQPPFPVKNFIAEFHDDNNNPRVSLRWNPTTDPDSLDRLITYEYASGQSNVSSTATSTPVSTSTLTWTTAQSGVEIPFTRNGIYNFYLRAKDELRFASEPATSTVVVIIPQLLAGSGLNTCIYCNTPVFATVDGAAYYYKIGQKFSLAATSTIGQIQLEIHNFAAPRDMGIPPSNFDGKVTLYSMADPNNPNAGLSKIYSETLTGLPALTWPGKNSVILRPPSLTLGTGSYFMIFETVGGTLTAPGQGISASAVESEAYPESIYAIERPNAGSLLWTPINVYLFFRVLGIPSP